MAERRATNKYYPPGWDPSKGSINKYQGSHPLRDRARKLSQGILIIRFEMPWNMWCGGCKAHIGKGVRYNAEKKSAGNYFSTKLWNFRMKCHLCDNYIEIETDPQNSDFKVVKGGSKKIETWTSEDSETIPLIEEDEAKKLIDDPFYKLEHSIQEVTKVKEEIAPVIARLQEMQDIKKNDYQISSLLRRKFRGEKKETEALKLESETKKVPVMLLPKSDSDLIEANTVKFNKNNRHKNLEIDNAKKKLGIKSESIFSKSGQLYKDRTKEQQRLNQISAITQRRGVSNSIKSAFSFVSNTSPFANPNITKKESTTTGLLSNANIAFKL